MEALGMRWEQLIEEFEADLDADERRELFGEVADRTRREVARLHLVDRLRAAAGIEVTIGLDGHDPVRGRVRRAGPDWVLVDSDPSAELLVVIAAITWITGLPARAVDPAAVSAVDQRLGLSAVLRAAARDRRLVHVWLRAGGEVGGMVGRAGADFVDLGAGRRGADAAGGRCVPFAAMAVVRLG
jgi:hypothetical protein